MGEHLQIMTEGAFWATRMKMYFVSALSRISSSKSPSTTKTFLSMCSSHLTKSSLRCLYSPALLMYILLVKTMKSCLIFFKSVLLAMHLAVSILSPVNIHTLTPACFNEEMVSATLSCRLSSTPVRQHRCASRSNLDIYCSRSSGKAARYCCMKSSYVDLEISF